MIRLKGDPLVWMRCEVGGMLLMFHNNNLNWLSYTNVFMFDIVVHCQCLSCACYCSLLSLLWLCLTIVDVIYGNIRSRDLGLSSATWMWNVNSINLECILVHAETEYQRVPKPASETYYYICRVLSRLTDWQVFTIPDTIKHTVADLDVLPAWFLRTRA